MAAQRMAKATREDCINAIFREMPRALAHAGELKHWKVVTDPDFQRERLTTLDPGSFERVSGACTADLLWLLTSFSAFDELFGPRGLDATATADALLDLVRRAVLAP